MHSWCRMEPGSGPLSLVRNPSNASGLGQIDQTQAMYADSIPCEQEPLVLRYSYDVPNAFE